MNRRLVQLRPRLDGLDGLYDCGERMYENYNVNRNCYGPTCCKFTDPIDVARPRTNACPSEAASFPGDATLTCEGLAGQKTNKTET